MMFLISKFVTFVFLPPGLFILLFLAAFALLAKGKKRWGLVIGGASLVLFLALSTAVVASALLRPLEDRYPPLDPAALAAGRGLADGDFAAGDFAAGDLADAPVVVLGGGTVERSPEEGMVAMLADEPVKRITYGLRVAKALGRPLVYSGGLTFKGSATESEADAARRFIAVNGFEVEAYFEGESRTTRENALLVERRFGAKAVILVTSAYHMPRSVLAFEQAGIKVLPAPTSYRAGEDKAQGRGLPAQHGGL